MNVPRDSHSSDLDTILVSVKTIVSNFASNRYYSIFSFRKLIAHTFILVQTYNFNFDKDSWQFSFRYYMPEILATWKLFHAVYNYFTRNTVYKGGFWVESKSIDFVWPIESCSVRLFVQATNLVLCATFAELINSLWVVVRIFFIRYNIRRIRKKWIMNYEISEVDNLIHDFVKMFLGNCEVLMPTSFHCFAS